MDDLRPFGYEWVIMRSPQVEKIFNRSGVWKECVCLIGDIGFPGPVKREYGTYSTEVERPFGISQMFVI